MGSNMAEQKNTTSPTPISDQGRAQRTANWAITGIFWIMALSVLTIAQSFFIPVATAILLALIFSPSRRAMSKLGVAPAISAASILLSIIVILSLSGYFLAGSVDARLKSLPSLIPEAISKLESVSSAIEPMVEASEQIDEMSKTGDGPDEVIIREGGVLSNIAKVTPRIIGQVGFTLVLMMFLISSGDLFYEKLVQIMPTVKDKRRAVDLVRTVERNVSTYFLTITIINAGLGVAVSLAMWGLGMPDPILFGIGAFLLNYIPFVGALIGIFITALVAIVTAPTVGVAIVPPLAYFALTAIEGQWVTPMLVGRRLRLNVVIVFLAVAMGAWMWSFMGMFLAIPFLIVIKAIAQEVESLESVGAFLGERKKVTRKDQRILDKAL